MNSNQVHELSLSLIRPNPNQPRKKFTGIEELTRNISEMGLLSPIMVRPVDSNLCEIITGERRYHACKLAGFETISAIIRTVDDGEAFRLALVENAQREDLSPIETAEAFAGLLEQGMTQAEIGQLVGKSQSYVAHKLRLLRMPEPIAFYLRENVLSEHHTRQIARLKGIYGADLIREINPLDLDSPSFVSSDSQGISTGAVLWLLRPEEYSPRGIYKASLVVRSGLKVFFEYVTCHKPRVPQWVVAGFWWASVAVSGDWTVAQLSHEIDQWEDRFIGAMYHMMFCHDDLKRDSFHIIKGIPPLWIEADDGYKADLFHSGMLPSKYGSPSPEWRNKYSNDLKLLDGIAKCVRDGSFSYPSRMQSWAPNAGRYADAIRAENERSRREEAEWLQYERDHGLDGDDEEDVG